MSPTFQILLLCIMGIASTFGDRRQLSVEEKNALVDLRQILKDNYVDLLDYQNKDSYLMQWLKAADLEPRTAAENLNQALGWRAEQNMDAILNETISLSPGYVVSLDGIDYIGHPIATLALKTIDIRKIVLSGNKNKLFRHNFQILEKMAARARLLEEITGVEINQIYVIVDFAGFSKKQHGCPSCQQALVSWYANALKYYPGLRYREVWINTPRSATKLVNSIKSLYSELDNEDLRVFGADKTEWSEFLAKDIPDDQITPLFGGSRRNHPFLTAI